MADGFLIAEAYVRVSPDFEGFAEELEAGVEEATAGVEAKVRVTVDQAELDEGVDEAKAKVDELDGTTATAKLGADSGELDEETESALEKLRAISETQATARLDADDSDLDEVTEDAKAKVEEVSGTTGTAKLDADDEAAKSKIAGLQAQLAILKAQKAGVEIDADATPAEVQIAQLEAQIEALKQEASTISIGGSSDGSLLGAVSMGVGSLLPGLGGAAAGMGLVGAAGGVAFDGIAKALSAAHSASENVGMTSQQLAAQQFSNSVQVTQAQQSVAQASEQSAQDQVSSADSIQSAQMNLTSVEQNAAQAQVQALQSVTQAQQGVQEATYNLSEANYNLGQAYVSAREAIVNANNALSDAKLNVQSATLAVAQAQQNELLVNQNAYSTDLDREQATLAVAQAKQQVTDATASESDAQTAANLANKQGVDGSQTVVQAKQAQKAAVYSLSDAQNSYADAQQNLTLTEANNARQITQAQQQVSQAQEQAAYQQQMDAQSVANAQKNLTDTIKEQQLQWESTQSTQNSAAQQFEQYMGKLTPAGRGFVKQVLAMGGAWHQFVGGVQNAVLPGATDLLKGFQSMLPTIEGGVTRMGKSMSSALGQIGKEMESPAAQKALTGLIDNGIQFANIVLPAFAGFFKQLAILGSKDGAVTGLADLLAGAANGLAGFAKGLTPYIPAFDQIFKALGKIAQAVGPAFAKDLGSIANLLSPLAKLLNSKWGGPFISALGQIGGALLIWKGTLKLLPDFASEQLAKLPGILLNYMAAPFRKASDSSKAFADGASADLDQAQGDTEAFVAENGAAMGEFAAQNEAATASTQEMVGEHGAAVEEIEGQNDAMVASSVEAGAAEDVASGGIGLALQGIVLAVTLLAGHWKQAWGAVKDVAETVWKDGLKPVFDAIAGAAEDLYDDGIKPYFDLMVGEWHEVETAAGFLWHDVLDPAFHGIASGAEWLYDNGIKPQFDAIEGAITGLQDAALWLWHNVFVPVFDGIESGAKSFVSGFRSAWDELESVFKTPVNFLITTVYDNGIRRFWNDVVTHIGLGSLSLPNVTPLAGGGVLPGYAPGHDTVPAMLSPGEGVLTPGATRAIGGAPTVNALNQAHPPSGGGGGGGGMLAKMGGKQLRKHLVERPAEHAATLGKFAAGGIVGDIGSFLGGAGHDIASVAGGALDIGKMIAAVATGNTAAFVNTAAGMIGTSAAGDLGKIMTGIPRTLVTDLATALTGSVGGGGSLASGASSAVGSLPQNWRAIASFLASHGASKYAAAGIAGNIAAESGGDPEQLEIGGGGGGGLIQWTPYPPGYITGNAGADLMTQLNAILSWGGGLGIVNRASSPSNAALLYQDYYEKPANLSASLPTRMSSANAVYKAMGWGSFDSGGWMPPGAPNFTGQPEAVLTPEESQAFVQLVKRMVSQPGAAGTGTPTVIQNYYGTQQPSVEQQAIQNRSLAMALSGG